MSRLLTREEARALVEAYRVRVGFQGAALEDCGPVQYVPMKRRKGWAFRVAQVFYIAWSQPGYRFVVHKYYGRSLEEFNSWESITELQLLAAAWEEAC